jgi:DNA-binding transcriptional LysR family regulator
VRPAEERTVYKKETMNISTDMLQAFVAVAERSSVSAAALALGLAKSVVSKRLAHLEEAVHVTLVARNSRTLSLTPAGQVYLSFAQRALTAMQAADEELRTLRDEPTGKIRLTAPVSWGHRALGKALPDFLAQFPEIEVELILQDHILDMAKERIDIALRMSATPVLDLVWIPIAKLDWVMCAAPSYIAAAGEPHSPAELAHHPCMNYWTVVTDDAWQLQRGAERASLQVRNRYRANNPEAILDAALAGLGVAMLPLYCCKQELAEGKLLPVLRDWQPVTKFGNQIAAAVAPDRVSFSRNQALLRFLKAKFSGDLA